MEEEAPFTPRRGLKRFSAKPIDVKWLPSENGSWPPESYVIGDRDIGTHRIVVSKNNNDQLRVRSFLPGKDVATSEMTFLVAGPNKLQWIPCVEGKLEGIPIRYNLQKGKDGYVFVGKCAETGVGTAIALPGDKYAFYPHGKNELIHKGFEILCEASSAF